MWRNINNLEANNEEKEKIIDFLVKNDDQLSVPISKFPGGIEGTIKLCSEKGEILVAEKGEEIIGLLGITFGEPSKNYENPEIGYLYLLLLDEKNRKKRQIAIGFFQKMLEEMKLRGIRIIRFKTYVEEEYLNKLYKKVAKIVGKEQNTQGKWCNLYEANVDDMYKSVFIDKNIRPLLKNDKE